MTYIIVALTVLLNVGANVFLNLGMRDFAGGAGTGAVLHMMKTPSIYMGVFCYGIAFVTYSLMLIRLNVSVAYPMMTGGIALTLAFVSRFWLGESIGVQQVLGIGLVVCGIFLLAR